MKQFDAILITDFNAREPEKHNRALGAYHIADILRQRGLEVLVIDFFFSYSLSELTKIAQAVISAKTKLIGISTTFIPTTLIQLKESKGSHASNPLLHFVNEAKKQNHSLKIFKGGSYHYFRESWVDHYLTGQAVEDKFLKLLNQEFALGLSTDYRFENHRFKFHDFDCIIEGEPLPIELSRGCIFNCKFCGFYGRGKKFNDRMKDFGLVREFLTDCNAKFGTRHFYLADDTFNESVDKLSRFSEMVSQLDFQPYFACYARAELFMRYPEMLMLARKSGIRAITLGIETFNRNAALNIGKSIQPEKIKSFLADVRTNYPEFHLSSGFIAGLPGEDLDSCHETNEWLRESGVLDSWIFSPLFIDNMPSNPFISEFSKNIEKYDYMREGTNAWKRKDLSFLDAAKFSYETNEANRPLIRTSAWNLFSLAPEHDLETVRKLSSTDFEKLLTRKKFRRYKTRMFELLGLSA